jgi:hypothetical protein
VAGGEQVEVVSAGGGWGEARQGKVKVKGWRWEGLVEGDPGRGGGVVNRVCKQQVVKGIG